MEKKYFETFMIESRKENKELKDKIIKGDQETIDRIKQIAREESLKLRINRDLETLDTNKTKLLNSGRVETPQLKPSITSFNGQQQKKIGQSDSGLPIQVNGNVTM